MVVLGSFPGGTMFALQLSAADFGETAVCLGPQVAAVLETLRALPELAGCAWYGAWIDPMGAAEEVISALRRYETSDEVLIEDIQNFIALSREVTQLLAGVVFAVPAGQEPHISDGVDSALGLFALNGVVEMRAEDTTFIEVVTASQSIVDGVLSRFGGKLVVG
jgi:hypothetical protein